MSEKDKKISEKNKNIRIKPADELSKYKDVELRFDNKNSLTALNEYSIESENKDIEFPNGNLEYLDKFKLFDNAKITMNPKTNIAKTIPVSTIDCSKPPEPEFKLNYTDSGLVLKISNYNDRYILKVIIDGIIQKNNFENTYIIKNEGNHVIYIEYVDDFLLKMSSIIKNITYKKKYEIPAPFIFYKDSETNANERVGFIYYHPASEMNNNYYKIGDDKYPRRATKSPEIIDNINKNESTPIIAYTENTDSNAELCLNTFNNASSISQRVRMPDKDSKNKAEDKDDVWNNWKYLHNLYNEYLKYNKPWNIEHFYVQEFKGLYRGEKYKDLSRYNKIKADTRMQGEDEIKIIGFENNSSVFSAFPHVARRLYHDYYITIDGQYYELGTQLDDIFVGKNKEVELVVGYEYTNPDPNVDPEEKISKGIDKIFNVTLDTTFPPYPKLTEDIESIMTEPFEVNVIRERNGNERIKYESKLNGKNWDINNERVRERYILEDGEYMLDMVAKKESNGTFRYKSSYFTINTFQHVPLKPLKSKIIPLRITNTPTIGTEGELVLDANSGNYGFIRNGEVYSPTAALSTELINIEENSNDISKMFLSCRNHIDTLMERYTINSKNMAAFFNGKNGSVFRYNVIKDECDKIKKEMITIDESMNDNENYLKDISVKLDIIKGQVDEFKDELEKDKKTAFKIIRNLNLVSFSNLHKARRTYVNLKNKINTLLLKQTFENYRMAELNRLYEIENYLYDLKNRGENNNE